MMEHGIWALVAGGIGPDLALLYGLGAGMGEGRLHPRAVPLYNLLHRFWLPLALIAAGALGLVWTGFVLAGVAWVAHIAIDRAVGYGLRTPEGFQRAT